MDWQLDDGAWEAWLADRQVLLRIDPLVDDDEGAVNYLMRMWVGGSLGCSLSRTCDTPEAAKQSAREAALDLAFDIIKDVG